MEQDGLAQPLGERAQRDALEAALEGDVGRRLEDLGAPLVGLLARSSCGDGPWRGRLAAGFAADLVIVDRDPFVDGERALLDAQIECTIVAGRTVFAR